MQTQQQPKQPQPPQQDYSASQPPQSRSSPKTSGLLNQAQAGQNEQEFSPEKIAMLGKAYTAAKNLLFDEQIFTGIMQSAEADIDGALRDSVVALIGKVKQDIMPELPADVALAVGLSVLAELVDVIEKGLGVQISDDQVVVAVTDAADIYLSKFGQVGELEGIDYDLEQITRQLMAGEQ